MKFQDLFQQTKDFQAKMQEYQEKFLETQADLLKNEYEGASSERSVVIVIDGSGNMKSLFIEPHILEQGSEVLQDLIKDAYNDAKMKANIVSPNNLVNLMSQFMPKGFYK